MKFLIAITPDRKDNSVSLGRSINYDVKMKLLVSKVKGKDPHSIKKGQKCSFGKWTSWYRIIEINKETNKQTGDSKEY